MLPFRLGIISIFTLITMAPAPNDPASATETNPSLCGVCPNPSTLTCSGCENIKYCTAACQQRDATQHNTLCTTFSNFQQRPTAKHYRSIYFPANKSQPRFIWLLFSGERGHQNVDRDDLARYVSGSSSGSTTVTARHGITPPRELKNMLVVQHDQNMFGNRQPANKCLGNMIRSQAARWLGSYVAHAFKYTYGDEEYQTDD
jgi:hypothetical protein